jgi:hypothetical protein
MRALTKPRWIADLWTYLQPVCGDSHYIRQKEGEVKAARGGGLAGCNLFTVEGFIVILGLFTVL